MIKSSQTIHFTISQSNDLFTYFKLQYTINFIAKYSIYSLGEQGNNNNKHTFQTEFINLVAVNCFSSK